MDCFHIGAKFSSFVILKKTLDVFVKECKVKFIIRDCLTLKNAQKTPKKLNTATVNWTLVYYRLKFGCTRGRIHNSRGQGLRNKQSWKCGCKASISFTITECGQFLEVDNVCLEHNHEIVPRPLCAKEVRAEKRRINLMKKLEIPYTLAYQLERKQYYLKYPNEHPSVKMKTKQDSVEKKLNMPSENHTSSDPVTDVTMDTNLNIINIRHPAQIYTKLGDSGTTSTFNNQKLSKDDSIFEAYGTAEELSSSIGVAAEFLPESCSDINKELRQIQSVLQDLVVHIGTPKSDEKSQTEHFEFPKEHVCTLEKLIDEHSKVIPLFNRAILPSGGKGSSAIHVARSVCRRAERRVVSLVRNKKISDIGLKFLNRLGDYLFVLARKVSVLTDNKEAYYKEVEVSQ